VTPHDLLANFETLAEAPDGVQRLRELVLELAVRGKLVRQDPQDEPAKAILGRIQSGRARQVTTKKKHGPSSMPVSQAECPFDIPDTWVWARASQLGIVNPRNDGADEAMVAFVPMAVLSTDYRAQIRPEVRPWKEIKKGYTHLADGDIAIAKITPCFENGKAAVFENLPGGYGAGTTELHILRPIPGTIDPHFFLLFFKSPTFVRGGVATMTGTAGQQRVSGDYFTSRPIPVPPLPEQYRIVARVDELMALLDRLEAKRQRREAARSAARGSALAALRDAPTHEDVETAWLRIQKPFGQLFSSHEDVAELRQSILFLGLRGSLVSHGPDSESAEILLKHIRKQKDCLIKDGKFRPDGHTPAIDRALVPFQIPTGWQWCRLKDLLGMVTSGSRSWKAHYASAGASFIRSQDIKKDRLEYDDRAFVNPPPGAEGMRTLVEVGDILITITGANVGKCAIICEDPGEAYISQHVALLKLISPEIGPYLHLWLTSDFGGRGLLLGTSYGAKPGLNLDAIRNLLVAVPPEGEIESILNIVRKMLFICDRLSVSLEDASENSRQFAAAAIHHLDM
jgi:type I restriction enzyme, S subunit